MENEENLAVLKDELKNICEQLMKQMNQLDRISVPAETQEAKLSC